MSLIHLRISFLKSLSSVLGKYMGIFSQGVQLLKGNIHFCGCHIFLFQVKFLTCATFVRGHYLQMVLNVAIFAGYIG